MTASNQEIHVVCAVIRHPDGQRILAAQRPEGKSQGGKWELPGGKVHADESPAEALQREILEELGVVISLSSALPAVRHCYPGFCIRLEPFLCQITAGQPQSLEHQSLQWILPSNWEDLDWAAADIPVLHTLAKSENSQVDQP